MKRLKIFFHIGLFSPSTQKVFISLLKNSLHMLMRCQLAMVKRVLCLSYNEFLGKSVVCQAEAAVGEDPNHYLNLHPIVMHESFYNFL